MTRGFSLRKILLRTAIFVLMAALVWWTLRQVSIAEMVRTLAAVHPLWIALLLAVNAGVIWLFGSRWWVILRALKHHPPYRRLVAYRLTAFGISYFTPGTQFGGEPAQVYLLSRRDGVSTGDAVLSVALDKLFELTFNFAFLGFGVLIVLRAGIFSTQPLPGIIAATFALAALPLFALVMLCRGEKPQLPLLSRLPQPPFVQKFFAALTGAPLCRRSPRQMMFAAGLSAAIWLALVAEYWLMTRALGLQLSFTETIVLLTAARLAFLFPTPGGLGALEAGQVIAMEALGFDPALGLSLSLLIRARDILFGAVGLWLGRKLIHH